MGWLDLFKARPDRKPTEAPRDPIASMSTRQGKVVIVEYKEFILAKEALNHPVIYRCLNKLAESVQQVAWFCERDPLAPKTDQEKAAGAISAINSVLMAPNDIYAADQLRYWMAMNYALYGRIPFKVGLSSNGRPNAIYPLATQQVQTQLNSRGQVESFLYGTGADAETFPPRSKGEKTGTAYAYSITRPNLAGSLASKDNISVTSAIGLPAQIINLLLRRAIDTASGHPNSKYVITTTGTLTNQQKKDLQEHLQDSEPGADSSGNVLILWNSDAKVQTLDNNLGDIHSKTPMDDMTRMIAAAFGIPVALVGLGAADAAKFASNYAESRLAFWADTVIPGYLTPIATGMTAALCPYGARIRFDLDSIEALRDHNIANAKTLETVSFLTKNEKRELVGFEKVEGGDVLDVKSSQPAQDNNE